MRKSLFVLMLVFISTATDYAAAKQKRMELTALNSMQRISQGQKATGPREVVIKAARNEVESFQVVVSAFGENINVVKVEISELVGETKVGIGKENIKLYREEYVRVRKSTPRADLPPGLYPDPLVPFTL